MQLGTRWSVGAETPPRLPAAVGRSVRAVEDELNGVDTTAWRWTLTWLEGRPVVELDDGTMIRYDPHTDSATVHPASGPAAGNENSPDEDFPESG